MQTRIKGTYLAISEELINAAGQGWLGTSDPSFRRCWQQRDYGL